MLVKPVKGLLEYWKIYEKLYCTNYTEFRNYLIVIRMKDTWDLLMYLQKDFSL